VTPFVLVLIVVFAIGSLGILFLSWSWLRDPRSYRFYRFFAFEFLLALVLVNVRLWFNRPCGLLQVLSWFLLLVSAFLALHGFVLLRKTGQPSGSIETTTALVTTGAYRYIRHPLYASLVYFGWGVFLKNPSPVAALLVLIASVFLFLTARTEEGENKARFGDEYLRLMARTKMFVPFLF
jgi:protein-S-isoprenylcysteine O-methyltransferase Ste14